MAAKKKATSSTAKRSRAKKQPAVSETPQEAYARKRAEQRQALRDRQSIA